MKPLAKAETPAPADGAAPTLEMKHRVLDKVYDMDRIKPLQSYQFLAAAHRRTQVGIFVVEGDFDHARFEKAKAEAKAAGLKQSRMYVYGRTASHAGKGICFCNLDDIGINRDGAYEGKPASA